MLVTVTMLPILLELDSLLLLLVLLLHTAVATAALRSERSTKKEATEEYRSSRTLKRKKGRWIQTDASNFFGWGWKNEGRSGKGSGREAVHGESLHDIIYDYELFMYRVRQYSKVM